ncbi:MAG: sugar phosphate isomerase/epimerase [Caldilineaceae bacterium]
MAKFRYGCVTFTWSMSGPTYVGALPHMCNIIKQAGCTGIETQANIMGNYWEDRALMLDLLQEQALDLAALAFGNTYHSPTLSNDEHAAAERIFDYLALFPEPRLSLSHYSQSRDNLLERQRNAIACLNAVGRLAADRGIACSFHPSSYPTSIFRVESDYQLMLDGLDPTVVTYCPDSGHIANGGMDVYAIFSTYASIIGHVHMKDISADRQWVPIGEGVIDFPRLLKILDSADYKGWISFEEESPGAVIDPDGATRAAGRYLVETLLPLGYGTENLERVHGN